MRICTHRFEQMYSVAVLVADSLRPRELEAPEII